MIEKKYINFHGLRMLFKSCDDFNRFCGRNILSEQQYSDLFYGTDSSVYVPLWASVAKTGDDILLNQVTLDIIRFYKSYGYSPIYMDGNPADFIGEQFRFLEYISSCALNGSMTQEEWSAAACNFENEFLTDTLNMIVSALCKYNAPPFVITLLEKALSGGYYEWLSDDCFVKAHNLKGSATCSDLIKSFDSSSLKKNPPLPVEEPHKISIASSCDCGSKCKMLATVCEGCLLQIEPDSYQTPLRFAGCPRGRSYGRTYLTSKRLRYPMERIGKRGDGKFRRISWEEAAEKIAFATTLSREKYGPGSRFVINAAGVCGAVRGDRFMKNLLALDGGYLDYYNYYSAACAVYINPYIYGKVRAGNHESTYLDSKLIIMWGFNPATCHYGLNTKDYFMRAKEKGAKIIVIDPRMSDTVMTMADRWIPIRPSSDTALIDAMAYTIWHENLHDQDFMDKFCIGFDEEHMPDGIPKTPAWAEKITGIPAETIKELAIEYAAAKPAALLPGFAPQRTMVGEQACRGFVALACMTGNVGISGGSTGVPFLKEGHEAPGMSLLDNPYLGKIPVFQWTRAIDRPETIEPKYRGLKGVPRLDSGIKVLYSLASGIVINQHSNIKDTERILKSPDKLDYLVLSDLFMTPSAKFADILLPGISFFEMDNIPSPWSDDDYLLYNHQITAPLFGGKFEYEWIRRVAELMDLKDSFDSGLDSIDQWIRHVYEECRQTETELPPFDEFKENSYYIYKERYNPINFYSNIHDGKPFDTPSGKIEIFSKTLYDMNRPEDIPGSPGHIYCAEGPEDPLKDKYPLQLIAYHTKRRCHSQHDDNPLLAELDPTALWINPNDAECRFISDGDTVEVFNDRGVMRIAAKVTERISAGTVAVSEGGWYNPSGDGADTGGCINTLTMSDKATPIANGNPQHTNLADVRKIL